MKKIILYISAFLSLVNISCKKDYLKVSPETVQDEGAFFRTGPQFVQAVNGAYAQLQPLHSDLLWVLAEMRSDNTSYQRNTGDNSGIDRMRLDEFREFDNGSHVTSFFNNSYSGISRCNAIISRAAGANISADIMDPVLGQAHFLRAYNYFNLVRLIGEVPLITAPITSVESAFANAARKPVPEIYATIISDGNLAVEKLPEAYANGGDKGRVAKSAAHMLLAKVYMNQGDFTKALDHLRAITNRQLLPDYASIFDPGNKNNAESIFEIQYTTSSPNEYSSFIYVFAPYNAGTAITGFPLHSGAGSGWNIPTKDMTDAYEPGDLRRDVSINTDFVDPNDGMNVAFINKYRHPHTVRGQTDDNFPVYRFADVKLMMAECLNELGYTADGEAFTHLNDVRVRAGLAAKTAVDLPNQDVFRESVRKERRVELAFENHRWFDLLRYGTAQQVMQAHGVQEHALKSHYLPSDSYSNISLLYQYPLRETQLNP